MRLYRLWNVFLSNQRITCRACTVKENMVNDQDAKYCIPWEKEHQLRGVCAAVPTEDGSSYGGCAAVPDRGVKWWDNLPKEAAK